MQRFIVRSLYFGFVFSVLLSSVCDAKEIPLVSLMATKIACDGKESVSSVKPKSGTAVVYGDEYQNTLMNNGQLCEIVFNLGRKYSRLNMVVGVPDDKPDGECCINCDYVYSNNQISINNQPLDSPKTNPIRSGDKPWVIKDLDISDAVKLQFIQRTDCVFSSPMLVPKNEVVSAPKPEVSSTPELIPSSKSTLMSCPAISPVHAQKLSEQLAQKVKAKSDKKNLLVVVAPFKPIQLPSACEETLPVMVQEYLLNALIDTDVFTNAERDRLDEVMKELNLQQSDLFDEKTARKIGKAVGADSVLIGSISMPSSSLTVIQARLVDVQKGTSNIAGTVTVETAK